MSPEIANFTASLFWDVDRETLDLEKSKALIVQRVLERGHDEDWALLKTCYTIPEIVQIAKQFRSLEPTALALAACIGNSKKEEFRCFTWKQSALSTLRTQNQQICRRCSRHSPGKRPRSASAMRFVQPPDRLADAPMYSSTDALPHRPTA